MNPYNSAERFMPRDYNPVPTVTFALHQEMRGDPMPQTVRAWAESNLPDGDYVAQWTISDASWHFARSEWIGDRRRIVQVPEVC